MVAVECVAWHSGVAQWRGVSVAPREDAVTAPAKTGDGQLGDEGDSKAGPPVARQWPAPARTAISGRR